MFKPAFSFRPKQKAPLLRMKKYTNIIMLITLCHSNKFNNVDLDPNLLINQGTACS